MRILLVSPADQEFGGVASVVGNLARYLKDHGHEVIFLHPGRSLIPKSKTTKWGFPGFDLRLQAPFGDRNSVISLALFSVFFPIGIYQLVRLIKKRRIDIVNIHFPHDHCFYFGLCRRLLPFKLVTSIHGADFFPGGERKAEYSRLIRSVLKASDLIVAPSRSYRKDFLGIFPALRKKTIFIHNGIDLAEFDAPQGSVEDEWGRYVLCIAAHNAKKGLDVLIRAVALLKDIDFFFQVLMVGDGPLREELEVLAKSLGVHGRIKFLGSQKRSEIVKLLRGSEMLVLPSRAEPFGIVIIEGMACKKPVIATAVGGIPEIIESGKNGILVKPDDSLAFAEALIGLLWDSAARHSLAKNAYLTVRDRFGVEKTGSTYEERFSELLGTSTFQGRQYKEASTSTCADTILSSSKERTERI